MATLRILFEYSCKNVLECSFECSCDSSWKYNFKWFFERSFNDFHWVSIWILFFANVLSKARSSEYVLLTFRTHFRIVLRIWTRMFFRIILRMLFRVLFCILSRLHFEYFLNTFLSASSNTLPNVLQTNLSNTILRNREYYFEYSLD